MQIRDTHKLSMHKGDFSSFEFLNVPVYSTLQVPGNLFQSKTSYIEALYKVGERFQICSVFLYNVYYITATLLKYNSPAAGGQK